MCGDGYGVAGNDLRSISRAIRAEIPDLNWPEEMDSLTRRIDLQQPPPTLAILDLIEFCYRSSQNRYKGITSILCALSP